MVDQASWQDIRSTGDELMHLCVSGAAHPEGGLASRIGLSRLGAANERY